MSVAESTVVVNCPKCGRVMTWPECEPIDNCSICKAKDILGRADRLIKEAKGVLNGIEQESLNETVNTSK